MLTAAMDALLSPLFNPATVRYVPLKAPIGSFHPPAGTLFPVDLSSQSTGTSLSLEDLAAGAMYVMCYRPMHRDAGLYRQLARSYICEHAPGFPAKLAAGAREAMAEGDWVGTVGRLWTWALLDPHTPEALDELAVASLHFGFATSARGAKEISARLAKACGAALNALAERFWTFAPGHLHRAEFLAVAGDGPGATRALRVALQLGLAPEIADDAHDLLRDVSASVNLD